MWLVGREPLVRAMLVVLVAQAEPVEAVAVAVLALLAQTEIKAPTEMEVMAVVALHRQLLVLL